MNVVSPKKVIAEEYMAVEQGGYWDVDTRRNCRKYFQEMQQTGKICGCYEDEKWIAKDGIGYFGMKFNLDRKAYVQHGMKDIAMSADDVVDALKTYTIWCEGDYTFEGLRFRLAVIRKVLECLGDKNLMIPDEWMCVVKDFLRFIGVSADRNRQIQMKIRTKQGVRTQRKLKPMLTYLAAADKVREIMRTGGREEKLKLFPVYLVMELGSYIPLRPTGFSILPYNCIGKDENGYTLTVRRTGLKKGKRSVTHALDGDYKLYTYSVPYTELIQNIEWYREETQAHERQFLLDYDETSIRDNLRKRFSLESINKSLEEFVQTYLNGTGDYSEAMDICGIKEFEPFTAGDMRPLALINLYFSGAPLDVCMELADHESMEVTYHYISNIKEIIECSSFMKLQKRINDARKEIVRAEKTVLIQPDNMHYGCNSEKMKGLYPSLADCDQRCIDGKSCVPCRHYKATEQEKKEYIEAKKQELAMRVGSMRTYIRDYHGETFDRQLIQFQKACEGYKDAVDLIAEQEFEKWKKMKGN